MSRRQVQTDSQEWSQASHQLQLVTGKSSLHIVSLFRFTQQPQSQQLVLQRQFKSDAVIQATDFNKQYIDQVVQKVAPLQDIVLHCGHINIHPQALPNKLFTFLLAEVELGCLGKAKENGKPKEDLSRLDSLLIQQQENKEAFQYNFFVRSHSQYNVKYEVNFTVGSDKQFNSTDFRCARCQNKTAVICCKTQNLFLCEQCSREHHLPKVMQGHILQRIDKINSLPICPSHNMRFTHYCLRRQKYLCPGCLQRDGAYGGSQHPVHQVSKLYEQKRQANQYLSAKQRQKLQNLLRNTELKRQEITQNYQETQRFIEQQYQKALSTLKQLYNDKITTLQSDQIALKMMHQKLQWAKAFIKFQEKSLKPIYYFREQHKFQVDVSQLKITDLQTVFTIKADLAAEGQIVVARRELIDRSRNRVPQSSRATQSSKQTIQRVQYSAVVPQRSALYQYNAAAQQPQPGQLFSLLENSNLNFFCVAR